MELTDEQIEKALSCCQWALKKCDECPLDPKTPCFTNLHLATLKYIERLKDATESAVQSFNKLETLYKIKSNQLKCVEEKQISGTLVPYRIGDKVYCVHCEGGDESGLNYTKVIETERVISKISIDGSGVTIATRIESDKNKFRVFVYSEEDIDELIFFDKDKAHARAVELRKGVIK